ncbi:MAG TPA: hypothetical protein VM327_10910 [Candidatus Thermoplasmatota archaeon]|nr:hypothetical protein [Candidatus Thermoplasmatota archaeon]
MSGTNAVVRLPAAGTLFGDAVTRYPEARITSIRSGVHEHDGRPIVDHMALVEGLPDSEVSAILLEWAARYGEAPQVLGGPLTLRLPIALDAGLGPTVAALLRLEEGAGDAFQRMRDGVVELWLPCATEADAAARCAELRRSMIGLPVLWLGTAKARPEDADCWSLLRMAAEDLVPDCLVAAA